MTHPDPAQTRGPRRPRDLVFSLAVLLVPIGAILLLFQYLGGDREVVVVDPGAKLAAARSAGLEVAEPRGLPETWKPTSAVVRRHGDIVTLRIGYVTPTGGFVQLIETNGDPGPLLTRELTDSSTSGEPGESRESGEPGDGHRGVSGPSGIERIDGTPWQAYPGRDKERALALIEQRRTVVVLGRAPATELRVLAASLHL